VLVLANGLAAPILLATRHWSLAAQALLAGLGSYWFAAGAWLRTPWGRIEARTPPPSPPAMSDRHAHLYIAAGLTCVIACVVALAIQALLFT